jgi:uncharacterized membrane protein YfcA
MPEPAVVAAILAAAFVSAIVGGMGGFGTGVILTAVLMPIIGAKAVVPVLSLAGVLINAGRLGFYRRHLHWPAVPPVLAGAIPLLFAGTWVYAHLDPGGLGVLIGALVLLSVPLRRVLQARRLHIGRRGLLIGGAVFGAANGVASGMGVIMVTLLLGAGLGGSAVLATDAVIAIVIDLVRAAMFGRFDLLDRQTAGLGLAIGLATIPGSWVASLIVERLHARLHVRVMEALIVAGGVLIVWSSLGGR